MKKYFSWVVLFWVMGTSIALAANYKEGVDYKVVKGIPEPNTPMVREFFSYNCGHCYRQDRVITDAVTQLGEGFSFQRTPVGAGRKSWILAQQAYYIAEQLNMTSMLHTKIFEHVQVKGQAFTQLGQVKALFKQHGVSSDKFDSIINSIDAKLAKSNYDLTVLLAGIRGVPSILVNGRYQLISKRRTTEELAALIHHLSDLKL